MAIPKRVPLIEHLPLSAPMSLHVFPSYYCNFKCSYCVQCLDKEKQAGLGFGPQTMPFEVFAKVIDDLGAFEKKPNALIMAGHGEPLTHPDIAQMVKHAKAKNAAERVEIVTNGSRLTHKLSDKLIEAGLTRLRISIQGLDAGDYKRVCGVELDFEDFIEKLRYFYLNKKDTELFVKIIDIALHGANDAARYHEIFDGICNTAVVEYLFPFIEQIHHEDFGSSLNKTKHGDGEAHKVDICAMPFYMMVVLPNGDVTGCCAVNPPVIYGNIGESNLSEIWNSACRRSFLHMQANGRTANKVCRSCTVPDYGMQQGDYLDEHREKLEGLYKCHSERSEESL